MAQDPVEDPVAQFLIAEGGDTDADLGLRRLCVGKLKMDRHLLVGGSAGLNRAHVSIVGRDRHRYGQVLESGLSGTIGGDHVGGNGPADVATVIVVTGRSGPDSSGSQQTAATQEAQAEAEPQEGRCPRG
jgi:hypothetical protein